jgi:hypothetical protein
MASKRPDPDRATVAGHVASKFSKFTRRQGFILALLAVLVGGVGAGVYYSAGSNLRVGASDGQGIGGQQIKGNENIQIGSIANARDVTINPKPKTRKREVFQNPGSPVVLVFKEIDEDPKLSIEYSSAKDKHLGWVTVGTEVKSLDEKRKTKGEDLVGMGSYTKVEILEGEFKGQTGWVTVSKIKSEVVQE